MFVRLIYLCKKDRVIERCKVWCTDFLLISLFYSVFLFVVSVISKAFVPLCSAFCFFKLSRFGLLNYHRLDFVNSLKTGHPHLSEFSAYPNGYSGISFQAVRITEDALYLDFTSCCNGNSYFAFQSFKKILVRQ